MRRLSETRVEGARETLVRWHARRDRRRRAATSGTEPEDRSDGSFGSGPVMPNRPRNHDLKVEEAARKRLLERLVRQLEDIRRLYLGGADLRHISKRLGISARTVYRYKDLAEPSPRSAYKRKRNVLDPYVPYPVSRWNEGCRNGKKLYREIRERGYRNSEKICVRFTARLRRAEARGKQPSSVPRARKGSVAGLSPTSKNGAALFMRREEKLNDEQKEYLKRLCGADEALADARRLTQEFNGMVRDLQGEKLDGWLEEAEACTASAMRRFAAGRKKDLLAVRAGLTEEWSNGPVEGVVQKLKLLKRQGSGGRVSSCSGRGCWLPEDRSGGGPGENAPFYRESDRAQTLWRGFEWERAEHEIPEGIAREDLVAPTGAPAPIGRSP